MRGPIEQAEIEEETPGLSPELARQAIERTTCLKAKVADKRKARQLEDFALVIGLTLVGAVPWTFIDVLKDLYALTRKWERREFDDIVLSVVVLAAGY